MLAELLRQQPRHDVGRPSRRERHNHAHRPGGISLCPRDARDDRQRGSACRQAHEFSAGNVHDEPLARAGDRVADNDGLMSWPPLVLQW